MPRGRRRSPGSHRSAPDRRGRGPARARPPAEAREAPDPDPDREPRGRWRAARARLYAASGTAAPTPSVSRPPMRPQPAIAPTAQTAAPTIIAGRMPSTYAASWRWTLAVGISAPRAATPTAMPPWRNVSFTPEARPLISIGALLIATPASAGLNKPVPTEASRKPGRMIVQLEFSVASVIRPSPAAISVRPPAIRTRAPTRSTSWALAPETKNMITVPGRYARPAWIADSPSTFCRYSVA